MGALELDTEEDTQSLITARHGKVLTVKLKVMSLFFVIQRHLKDLDFKDEIDFEK